MAIYRKGDDQFPLWNRAKEQEAEHTMSEADSGGYLAGRSKKGIEIGELKDGLYGETPISAKGMRMGKNAKHWLEREV